MPAKSNARNWKDVQTAIATAAIVMTLGLWNSICSTRKSRRGAGRKANGSARGTSFGSSRTSFDATSENHVYTGAANCDCTTATTDDPKKEKEQQ